MFHRNYPPRGRLLTDWAMLRSGGRLLANHYSPLCHTAAWLARASPLSKPQRQACKIRNRLQDQSSRIRHVRPVSHHGPQRWDPQQMHTRKKMSFKKIDLVFKPLVSIVSKSARLLACHTTCSNLSVDMSTIFFRKPSVRT